MASIIIKTGNSTNLKKLEKGELALTEDTNKVYIGNGDKNINLIDEYSTSISGFYTATLDLTNCYKITTGKKI